MNTLMKVYQLGNLVALITGVTIEVADKLKAKIELDPDFSVSIERLGSMTEAEVLGTKTLINNWRESVGLPPLE